VPALTLLVFSFDIETTISNQNRFTAGDHSSSYWDELCERAASVERVLGAQDGMDKAEVNFATSSVKLTLEAR